MDGIPVSNSAMGELRTAYVAITSQNAYLNLFSINFLEYSKKISKIAR